MNYLRSDRVRCSRAAAQAWVIVCKNKKKKNVSDLLMKWEKDIHWISYQHIANNDRERNQICNYSIEKSCIQLIEVKNGLL